MKRIAPHKIEEIFAAADIVDVVGEFVELKKRGTNWFGLSPFVNEKTPSFAVSPNKNIFKDFSSGKGGNAVTFLMEAEGMSYVEALKWLAERYNIELQLEETEEDLVVKDRRESLFVVNEFAARWFHTQLTKEEEGKRIGLPYFKERGILETTIEEFQLGYSPEKWDAFASEAKKQLFAQEFLVETGLCFTSEKDGSLLDRFRGRVMFPITDHLGKTVGFGGRILDKTKKAAKYVNSPESEIYHKSRVLYGLHQAKQQIRDLDFAILVEGYMDVISLFQAGIRNAVASSGTALTEDQIRLIKRFTTNILLIYDSDNAGVSAALRGADSMLEQDVSVRILLLPEGHDPDSFVQEKGKNGFDDYLKANALDYIFFKVSHLRSNLKTSDPIQLSEFVHDIASSIAKINDEIKVGIYIQEVSKRIGVGADILGAAVHKQISKKAGSKAKATQGRNPYLPYPQSEEGLDYPIRGIIPESAFSELEILRNVVNYPQSLLDIDEGIELVKYFVVSLGDVQFVHPELERFKKLIINNYSQNGRLAIEALFLEVDKDLEFLLQILLEVPYEVSRNYLKFGLSAPRMDEDLENVFSMGILYYKFRRLSSLINQSMDKIFSIERRIRTIPKDADEMIDANLELDELLGKYKKLILDRTEVLREIGIYGPLNSNISGLRAFES